MKPILLGVNIDHIATLRQARQTLYPDLVTAANIAIESGADSITVHLREDRRHIQDIDVVQLKQLSSFPLNLELAVIEEMLEFTERIKPDYCCYVPERREELTTEGGLDVVKNKYRIQEAYERASRAGIRVSLFIDADEEQIQASADAGARVVEIHTGHYADAPNKRKQRSELALIHDAVTQCIELGIQVNAGHGLNYDNIRPITSIPEIHELNIGHAIISRAVFSGLAAAVKEMKTLMQSVRFPAVTSRS